MCAEILQIVQIPDYSHYLFIYYYPSICFSHWPSFSFPFAIIYCLFLLAFIIRSLSHFLFLPEFITRFHSFSLPYILIYRLLLLAFIALFRSFLFLLTRFIIFRRFTGIYRFLALYFISFYSFKIIRPFCLYLSLSFNLLFFFYLDLSSFFGRIYRLFSFTLPFIITWAALAIDLSTMAISLPPIRLAKIVWSHHSYSFLPRSPFLPPHSFLI